MRFFAQTQKNKQNLPNVLQEMKIRLAKPGHIKYNTKQTMYE